MRDGDRGHWLPFLEWMVTTSCDLACAGCDRFIDYDHAWHEELKELKSNMTAWSKLVDPDSFTIIGGEPLIHPKIYDIVRHSRQCFDHAKIEMFSNGLLLHKKPEIMRVLLDVQPAKMQISIHNRQENIRNQIKKNIHKYVFDKYPFRAVSKGIWKYQNLEFQIDDLTEGGWYDYRQTINGQTKPFSDNDPVASYNACGCNTIPIIYNNRLYKCPPISMLRTHANKYGLKDDLDWQPYLEYDGLGLDATETELENFAENVYEPHAICAMCPANPKLKPQENAILKGTHKL